MRKLYLTIIILILLFGCKKNTTDFRLEGEIAHLHNDTLLIYELQKASAQIDTIFVRGGSFSHVLHPDTLTAYKLLFPGTQEYVIFANKGIKTTIKGDSSSLDRLQIKGGELNDQLNETRLSLSGIHNPDSVLIAVDSLIRNNPYSYISVYLLDQYFIRTNSPDFSRIQSLIASMSGELQDLPYIKQFTELLKKQQEIVAGKRAPTFSLKNEKGETISLNHTTFKDKTILLNFWASWSEDSRKENEMMKRLRKKFKKEKVEFVGISLDMNKTEWTETIKTDTLSWTQLNDFNGWNGSNCKQYGVEQLPFNILINPRKNIIGKNLTEVELTKKLEEIFKEEATRKSKKN